MKGEWTDASFSVLCARFTSYGGKNYLKYLIVLKAIRITQKFCGWLETVGWKSLPWKSSRMVCFTS